MSKRNDLPSPKDLGIVCPHTERSRYARGLCATCHRTYLNYACSKNRLSTRERQGKYNKKINEFANRIKRTYGITLEQYDRMMVEQRGVCYICHIPPVKRLQIDHCHVTNRVRGLLCGRCNRGLAHMRDNTESFRRAIQYLERRYDGREL